MSFKVYRTKKRDLALAAATLKASVTYVHCTKDDDGKLTITASTTSKTDFTKSYSPTAVKDYPPEKLAQIFLQYALASGGTIEALELIGSIITLTEKDKEMATTKATTTAKKAPVKKAGAKKTTAKAPAKKAAAKKPPTKAEAEKAMQRPSAASRFKTLIMEKGPGGKCKHTDDEIFAMVQKEFDLPDKKRTYVAWYRNDLKKRGETPPEPKAAA